VIAEYCVFKRRKKGKLEMKLSTSGLGQQGHEGIHSLNFLSFHFSFDKNKII